MKRGASWEMIISMILLVLLVVLSTIYFISPLKKGASLASITLVQRYCRETQKTPVFYINALEEALKMSDAEKKKEQVNMYYEEMKKCFPDLTLPVLEEDIRQINAKA